MIRSSNEGTAEVERALTTSSRHQLLADARRRVALDVLATQTGPVDLDELAVAVATRETDAETVPDEVVQRVRISLHHRHLPKMDGMGVVDYDQASNRIESTRVLELLGADVLTSDGTETRTT